MESDEQIRPRTELTLRTEFGVGVAREGWWAYVDADGRRFYEAGPFESELEAREAARGRLRLFETVAWSEPPGRRDELLREESVPPPSEGEP